MRESLFPEHRVVAATSKLYTSGAAKLEKLMEPLLAFLSRIGQGQLIRRQIAYSLQFGCQLDAHLLYQALDTFNASLLNDVLKHYRQPDKHPYPPNKSPLLSETVALLEACGLDDPLHKVRNKEVVHYPLYVSSDAHSRAYMTIDTLISVLTLVLKRVISNIVLCAQSIRRP